MPGDCRIHHTSPRSVWVTPGWHVHVWSATTTCQGSGWYKYITKTKTTYLNCYRGSVTNCPSASDQDLTYGFLDPALPPLNLVPVERGVIVIHSGQGGRAPADDPVGVSDGDFEFADYYFNQGYVIVELAWDTDWEYLQFPVPPNGYYGNIQLAACRPATFFNWVFTNIYAPIQSGTNPPNPNAGMCGHGFSAGSGALAFTMAYYKATSGSWWWDNVELLAGPQFGDVNQGCGTGTNLAPPQIVCGQKVNGQQSQWGCQLGTDTPWSDPPQYVGASIGWVGNWTNDATCANSPQTSPASGTRWLQQSIVNDGTNNPVFNYKNTAMAGWLCSSVSGYNQQQCSQHYDQHICPNNSSAQGQIFYAAITANGAQPKNYAVYSVDQCTGAEGVGNGTVNSLSEQGLDAIKYDMAGNPLTQQAPMCVYRQNQN